MNGELLGKAEEVVEDEWVEVGEDVDSYSDVDLEIETSLDATLMERFVFVNHLEEEEEVPLKRRGDSDRNQRHKRRKVANEVAALESARRSTQSLLSFGFASAKLLETTVTAEDTESETDMEINNSSSASSSSTDDEELDATIADLQCSPLVNDSVKDQRTPFQYLQRRSKTK